MAGRTTPRASSPRLSARALNRALLARQLLLRRHDQVAGAGQREPTSQDRAGPAPAATRRAGERQSRSHSETNRVGAPNDANRVGAPSDANRVVAAVELLVGLQAQAPRTPYLGLWSRLDRFDPAELSTLLPERRVVRIALMRSTIHLVSADDCLALRPLVAPALERSLRSNHLRYLSGVDLG
ncbi:MAG TPA: crosslink repair DNA glycosylase YcaQ family protein, partial [Micromonosporaceae bacterium]